MSARRKPTRHDLIIVIARLQHHLSGASMYAHDENSDPSTIRQELDLGMQLCFDALAQDPPVDMTPGPWGSAQASQDRLS